MKPLTEEQRRVAEENHNLVYEFLHKNHLAESEYYDVVVFGYLQGVQDYCEKPALHRYTLSTVAWKKMQCKLNDHYRRVSKRKRNCQEVELSDLSANVVWENELMQHLEMELLLHALASKLPRRPMRIIRMKLDGAKMHEIARAEHMTFHEINRLLADSYETVKQICTER